MTDLVLGAITGRESGVVTDVNDLKYQLATAWVNFDGTGTVAIRDSYNVSSITDNGTGNYTANFAAAMDNTNFVLAGVGDLNSTGTLTCVTQQQAGKTINQSRFYLGNTATHASLDCPAVMIVFFGGKN